MGENTVLNFVRHGHDRIVTILNRLLGDSKSLNVRKNYWDELRREISRHSLFEEEMLYSRMRIKSGNVATLQITTHHHAACDRLLNRLESLPFNSSSWLETLRELREAFVGHVKYEEKQLRSMLSKFMAPRDVINLCIRLKSGRAIA